MIAYCLFGIVTAGFSLISVIFFFASLSLQFSFGRDELNMAPAGTMALIVWTVLIQILNVTVYVMFMEYDPCLYFIKENLGTCSDDLEINDGCCCGR